MYRWWGRHLSSDGACAFILYQSGLVLACALQSVMFWEKKEHAFTHKLEAIFLKCWLWQSVHSVTITIFFISIIWFCFTATNAVLCNQIMLVRQPQNILQDASLRASSQLWLVGRHLKRKPKSIPHTLPYSFCRLAHSDSHWFLVYFSDFSSDKPNDKKKAHLQLVFFLQTAQMCHASLWLKQH